MDVVGRCGVGTGALEQDEVAASGTARRRHGIVDLVERRDTRRDDQRSTGRRGGADQREIDVLERCDLVARWIELLEELDRRRIERGAEALDAQFGGSLHDRLVPLPGRVCFFVEVVQRASVPQRLGVGDRELVAIDVEGHRVGRVGLELERVRPTRSDHLDDLECTAEISVVVARHLGDDERRMIATDEMRSDLDAHGRHATGGRQREPWSRIGTQLVGTQLVGAQRSVSVCSSVNSGSQPIVRCANDVSRAQNERSSSSTGR